MKPVFDPPSVTGKVSPSSTVAPSAVSEAASAESTDGLATVTLPTGEEIQVPLSFMNPALAEPPAGQFTASDRGFPGVSDPSSATNVTGVYTPPIFSQPQTTSPLADVLRSAEGKKPARHDASRESSTIPRDDPRVLCNSCRYAHVIKSPAPVGGRRADGSEYTWTWVQCLKTSPPTELEDARPIECNLFKPKKQRV